MQTPSCHALLWAFLALPAAPKEPSPIPSEGDARKAHYACLLAHVADQTESDATPDQLVTAAESNCENEYDNLLLAILARPDIERMTDKPLSLARDIREDIVEQTRRDIKRSIFEARQRPKPK